MCCNDAPAAVGVLATQLANTMRRSDCHLKERCNKATREVGSRRFGQPNCQNQKASVVSNILGCIILGMLLQFHLHMLEYFLSFLILIHKWDSDVYSIKNVVYNDMIMICLQYLHPSPNLSQDICLGSSGKWINRFMSSNSSFLQLKLEVCINLQPRQI